MAAGRNRRRAYTAFANGSVQGRLADPQDSGGRARGNKPRARERFRVIQSKPAVPAWSDDRRFEQSPRDGAKNCRSADAEALC